MKHIIRDLRTGETPEQIAARVAAKRAAGKIRYERTYRRRASR